MDRDTVIDTLRAHEEELRAAGVASLSVFGSVARGESGVDSDVDVVVRLTEKPNGFAWFGHLNALTHRLQLILGRPVDVITEPVRKERLRRAIEKDRARAF